MKKNLTTSFIILLMITAFLSTASGEDLPWHASGKGGIVASGAGAATSAGLEMLRQGGNAVDAAVATIFNLAVSDYGLFCIGGEVPFMFYDSKTREVIVFKGMGGAPMDPKAIEWYYSNGIPSTGIRSATVPSAVSTLLAALELKGTMTFARVIGPTLVLLDKGGKSYYI